MVVHTTRVQQVSSRILVFPFNGAEAARPDLRYTPFSLTKLRHGRAYTTCSLPQYGQIPPAAAMAKSRQTARGIDHEDFCRWIVALALGKSVQVTGRQIE